MLEESWSDCGLRRLKFWTLTWSKSKSFRVLKKIINLTSVFLSHTSMQKKERNPRREQNIPPDHLLQPPSPSNADYRSLTFGRRRLLQWTFAVDRCTVLVIISGEVLYYFVSFSLTWMKGKPHSRRTELLLTALLTIATARPCWSTSTATGHSTPVATWWG